MILIADSGSSKTDWRIINDEGSILQAQTIGFNPFYQSQKQLDTEVREMLLPQLNGEINAVYYYGAGCSTDSNRKIIRQVFEKYFDRAHIEVWHDLLAAARALCGKEAGIACIIGTGINSCYYDGNKVIENVAALGYVLGDEGGGAYLGKKLVADYLRKDMPQQIWDKFIKRFGFEKEEILDKIYKEEMPSRFLASFSKFIFQNIKDPYCYRLVYESFTVFFKKNIVKYDNYKTSKIHFTGSVAFYYGNILRQVTNDLGLTVGNIVESPIAGLTLYHQKSITKI